ncbi:MAG: hypothetical protein GX446_17265 [Chthonomonadales bacterium]|nr:hypothetical protein [Chthonomonadales bacterium]
MIAIISLLGALAMPTLDLPTGPTPDPVPIPHFPDRLHAFVWRNWQLVPAERMARVVGARRADIVALGRSMGLQGPPRISADQFRRSHVTIIRRNWHLLPYEQLMDLLGWTREELAFALREDDFLYVKLGNLKPRCDRLVYAPPSSDARRRAARIAAIIKEEFPAGVGATREPLFRFVRQLSSKPATPASPVSTNMSPRFCYSYFGLYGDPLLDPKSDPYPEGYLARLAAAGVDGVWLQGVLSKLTLFPWQPELSEGYEKRIANLRRLVARAKRHGIKVFLYLNEPRAMPNRFFDDHPELKGVTEGDFTTLCTSVAEVRSYLVNAVAAISRAVPDLGGFFTITASENLTNCWSHFGGAACPRCSQRPAADVITDVNRAFAEGVRAANGKQMLIAWDWGWPDEWAEDAIHGLPQECALMSVSEWDLPINRGGIATSVGEYSLSAVGPGPRARRHWEIARRRGLRTLAKIQAAATWEMSAMPYVPAVRLTAQHAANLRSLDLSGLMLGWTLGGYPSPNLDVVREVASGKGVDEALEAVARARYGPVAAAPVVAAWSAISEGFAEFPYHVGVVYTAPLQAGPSNLLFAKPTGYRATMVGIGYDDLNSWRAVYPPEVFYRQLRKVADGFAQGARILRGAAQEADQTHRGAVEAEARVAEASALHFRSVAAQSEFILLRSGANATESVHRRLRELLLEEKSIAKELYNLQIQDSRIGFEATNQYYYVPCDLAEKVLNCRWLLGDIEIR